MEKENLKGLIKVAGDQIDIFRAPGPSTSARLLEAARDYLLILEQPPNKKLQTDKEPCVYCKSFADGGPLSNFCPNCGMALYR